MTTSFERLYSALLPFEHPLHQRVNRILRSAARSAGSHVELLDVGGRRSNYTIGVPAKVFVTDIPRESNIQHRLDLGTTDEMMNAVRRRRSNISSYLIDDMTATSLDENRFAVVCAVEVLEHVEKDADFVRNVHRVLKPGGTFVMTTPNGDFRPVPYPDHKRHYRRDDLARLLRAHFADVTVEYRVNSGPAFRYGLHRPTAGSPIRTSLGMLAFGVSALYEQFGGGGTGPDKKLHLLAICRKG
jgi:SAM-dependent methyltransferase